MLRPRHLLVALLSAALLATAGCSTISYYTQAVGGHLDVMARRRAIKGVIADPATPETLRRKLRLALQIRTFASRELGLPDNASYRSYADLGRPYAVWNVVATPRFSLQPLRSCFPVVGCLPYRGYYRKADALAWARTLRRRGYEVSVGGVPAYSTLGWFADPLLNTMMRWSDARLAGFVFHELAHQWLYFKGDTIFNESFATVVEHEGVRRWLLRRGDRAAWRRWRLQQRRDAELVNLLMRYRQRLQRLYRSGADTLVMQARKQAIFRELHSAYVRLRRRWGGYRGYDRWMAGINNAHLAVVATYHGQVAVMRRLLRQCGGNLRIFHRLLKTLGNEPSGRRHDRLRRLSETSADCGFRS